MPDYSVLEFINRRKPEIIRSIDQTLSNRSATGATYEDGMPDPAIRPYIPETSYSSSEAAFLRFKRKRPTLAFIRGTDGEVILDREEVELNEERKGNVKIAKGITWVESDFELIKKIQDWRAAGGAANIAAANELLERYMTTPAALTNSWANTLMMLCMRVAVAGKAAYTDEFSEIPVEIDYTAQIPSGHLATAKTGTGRWSQLTSADGTADIISHLNAYYANLKMFPPVIGMGSTEADNLRSQNKTRLKVNRFLGRLTSESDPADPSTLPRPTLTEIQQYIASELTSSAQSNATAPTIVVTDAIFYRRRKATGLVESGLYLPAGYYAFMTQGYIEAARFPVATNNFANGLAIVTKRNDFVPREEHLAIDGAAIPLVPDPRYLASRNVENTAIA